MNSLHDATLKLGRVETFFKDRLSSIWDEVYKIKPINESKFNGSFLKPDWRLTPESQRSLDSKYSALELAGWTLKDQTKLTQMMGDIFEIIYSQNKIIYELKKKLKSQGNL